MRGVGRIDDEMKDRRGERERGGGEIKIKEEKGKKITNNHY